MLVLSIFATIVASGVLSLFDSDDFEGDSNPSCDDCDAGDLNQISENGATDLLAHISSTTEDLDHECDGGELTTGTAETSDYCDQPVGFVEFRIVDASQGKMVTNDGLFIVEGASEVPAVFRSSESCLDLFRLMTGGENAPESDEYSSVVLIWNGPNEHTVDSGFDEDAVDDLQSAEDPVWAVELSYVVG